MKCLMLSLSLTFSLVVPGMAHAQSTAGTAETSMLAQTQVPPAPPATSRTGARVDERSPVIALTGSMLSTGAGLALMSAGLTWENGPLFIAGLTTTLIGPDFGHFYAGETNRGLVLVGVRVGAAAMTSVGYVWTVGTILGSIWDDETSTSDATFAAGVALLVGGLALGAGSTLYSFYDAPLAARRYNDKVRLRQLVITPAPMVGPDHSLGLGLQLGARF